MFYVYVLKSVTNKSLYIGQTNDLKRRFHEHNTGQSQFTKSRGPYKLIYYEAYQSAKDAKRRELKLKQFKNSYTELKKRIGDSLHEA